MHSPIDALKHGREDFMAGLNPLAVDVLIYKFVMSLYHGFVCIPLT